MNHLNAVMTRVEDILNQMGIRRAGLTPERTITDEPYSQDYSLLAVCGDAPVYTVREARYKNEYHDAKQLLVQVSAVSEKANLGTVKRYLQQFVDCYLGRKNDIALRPAFIYQTVPAIESSVDGIPFGAGGLIRPEVLRKAGYDDRFSTGFSFVLLPEALEELGKAEAV